MSGCTALHDLMFDLLKLPAHYVATYGVDRVAEVCGQTRSVISMWVKREKFPLDAVAKLLTFDPAPLGAITPLYTIPELKKNLVVLVPLSGKPEPKMMDCLLKLYDPAQMGYQRLAFNAVHVARNALAAWWLRSPAEWAWWHDGDNVWPCADAAWFKDATEQPEMPDSFAGLHSIYRMLYHKKSIVSGFYPGRKTGVPGQFGGASIMREQLRRGPQNRIIEVPWVGFGGCLTHRSVFEAIIRTQGDEIRVSPNSDIARRWNYEYAFFHPQDPTTPGEDIPWCARAAKAGYKVYVDLAVMGGHIGDRTFGYKDL